MTGVIALQGGGPFTANDDLDARLLAEVGAIGADGADGAGRRVVVLPTADAFEHPERLVTAAIGWAERLGVEVEALMVLRRGEAMDDGAAEVVRAARAVYLVGSHTWANFQDFGLGLIKHHIPVLQSLGKGGVIPRFAFGHQGDQRHRFFVDKSLFVGLLLPALDKPFFVRRRQGDDALVDRFLKRCSGEAEKFHGGLEPLTLKVGDVP